VDVAGPAEVFEALRAAHAKADADGAARLYAPDAVYYGPDNLVHKGPEEIRNHLASYFANRGPVEVTVKRQVSNGTVLLTEWTSSYTQGGRRWSGTPGASVIEVGRHGITYQRDYQ
jgi:uncharacterized protein (TIGR02246 family)